MTKHRGQDVIVSGETAASFSRRSTSRFVRNVTIRAAAKPIAVMNRIVHTMDKSAGGTDEIGVAHIENAITARRTVPAQRNVGLVRPLR